MRDARLNRSGRPLGFGIAGTGVDVAELLERLERLAPIFEGVLQTAGYLILTAGAVWLLFRFAP